MGVDSGAQLASFAASVLLGIGFSLLYDLFRPLRLHRTRRRALTDLLDAVYCLFLISACFLFTLRIGGGELRIYMLIGVFLGAVVWFSLFSVLLQPLWDFWTDVFLRFLTVLAAPFRLLWRFFRKHKKIFKTPFLFLRHSVIINRWKTLRHSRRRKEGVSRGGKAEEKAE